MSTLLTHAVNAIANLQGEATAGAIERVDLSKDGSLFLHGADERDEPQWYRYHRRSLTQLHPLQDRKLPLLQCYDGKSAGHVRILTWRPGRRIVLREFTPDGEGPILKGYRKGRSLPASVRHRAAIHAASASGIKVAPLRSRDPERELLIFGPLAGGPLDLSNHGVDYAFRIGALLRQLQSTEHNEHLSVHTAQDELAVIERWFDIRERVSSKASSEETSLLKELRELASRLPDVKPRLCHRDLHDGQLLVGPRGIALLDFDLLCLADPALDAANLLAHFSLRALQGLRGATVESSRALGDALLEGIDPSDERFWRQMRFYQAASLLRLSQLYLLRPKWNHIAPDLFQLAQRCTHEIHSI